MLNEESQDELLEDQDTELFCELMSHHSRHAREPGKGDFQIDKNLLEARHVWVRKEGVRPSLSPIYEGPYLVTKRNSKYFTILCFEGESKVSVDRLKVAYVLNYNSGEDVDDFDDEETVVQTDYPFRRSKRVGKMPDRLTYE